jgi:hypothetical protein
MAFKYIIFEYGRNRWPLLFPGTCNHEEVARYIRGKPVSAGRISFHADGSFFTYNESESLKLKSSPEDAAFIKACYDAF